MVDYSNENADSFLKVLYENKINVLDLRKELNKDYPNHFDAFFLKLTITGNQKQVFGQLKKSLSF